MGKLSFILGVQNKLIHSVFKPIINQKTFILSILLYAAASVYKIINLVNKKFMKIQRGRCQGLTKVEVCIVWHVLQRQAFVQASDLALL